MNAEQTQKIQAALESIEEVRRELEFKETGLAVRTDARFDIMNKIVTLLGVEQDLQQILE